MDIEYIYTRKDGGNTTCYGLVEEDSNFEVVCEDEALDGIYADGLDFIPEGPAISTGAWEEPFAWWHICRYLEENYDAQIIQLESC